MSTFCRKYNYLHILIIYQRCKNCKYFLIFFEKLLEQTGAYRPDPFLNLYLIVFMFFRILAKKQISVMSCYFLHMSLKIPIILPAGIHHLAILIADGIYQHMHMILRTLMVCRMGTL